MATYDGIVSVDTDDLQVLSVGQSAASQSVNQSAGNSASQQVIKSANQPGKQSVRVN